MFGICAFVWDASLYHFNQRVFLECVWTKDCRLLLCQLWVRFLVSFQVLWPARGHLRSSSCNILILVPAYLGSYLQYFVFICLQERESTRACTFYCERTFSRADRMAFAFPLCYVLHMTNNEILYLFLMAKLISNQYKPISSLGGSFGIAAYTSFIFFDPGCHLHHALVSGKDKVSWILYFDIVTIPLLLLHYPFGLFFHMFFIPFIARFLNWRNCEDLDLSIRSIGR